uniref:Uncharacterized protein n=1 Tax=Anguilla anguilla TaxID=7936 RepID=A0A0E9XAN4_ANGAN
MLAAYVLHHMMLSASSAIK